MKRDIASIFTTLSKMAAAPHAAAQEIVYAIHRLLQTLIGLAVQLQTLVQTTQGQEVLTDSERQI